MNWYVAKLIFQIVSGEGKHNPQFDEQLRLISAASEQEAYQKARTIGQNSEDNFLNNQREQVKWQFIDVAEINVLTELADGTELYYQIHEAENADLYIAWAHHKSSLLAVTA